MNLIQDKFYSGKQFLEITNGQTFYKIFDYEVKDLELCLQTQHLSHLYFISFNNINKFSGLGQNISSVIIPLDALILIKEDRFITTKLIAKKSYELSKFNFDHNPNELIINN